MDVDGVDQWEWDKLMWVDCWCCDMVEMGECSGGGSGLGMGRV